MNDNQKIQFKKILCKFLKIFAWITSSLVVLILALSLYIHLSKDKIRSFVVDEINKHLLTEISVREIDVSLFRNFPYVSLVFEDVVIPEVINKIQGQDTLIEARWVSLQFNLWDVIKGKYRLRRVNIEESKCHLKILSDGTPNYNFWKTDTTTAEVSDFELLLSRVRCDQLEFLYANFYTDVHMKLIADKFIMAGRFYESTFDMSFSGEMQSEFFSSGDYHFLRGIPVECSGKMNADIEHELYTFSDALLVLGNVNVYFEGTYTDAETPLIDISAHNDRCQLSDFTSLLPDSVQKDLEMFEQSGTVAISAVIKGPFSRQQLPSLAININLKDGTFQRDGQDITLDNLSFSMDYLCANMKNHDNATLSCRSFSAVLGSGSISGKFSVEGFARSIIKAELAAEVELEDAMKFIDYKEIESMRGRFYCEISFSNEFAHLHDIKSSDFTTAKSSGKLQSDQIEMRFRNFSETIVIHKLTGVFSEKDLILEELSLATCNSDISLSGVASNIFPFLIFHDGQLQISGEASSNMFHVDRLFAANSSGADHSDSEQPKYWVNFSPDFKLDLQLKIGEINYDSFKGKNVKTHLLLNNGILLLRDMSFASMDGTVEAEIIIDARQESTIDFRVMSRFNNIDITMAFADFKNFGQSSLTDKHLKGHLSGTVHFSSEWSKSLEINMESVTAVAHIKIIDGAIINYEPLSGLRKYFRRRDFSNVEFATLTNEIVIQDKEIIIPEMTIQSNVMDFEMQGTHDFSNNINYNFEIRFSELINRQGSGKPRAEEEYGTIAEDNDNQLTWHFKVTGTVDDPRFVPLDIRSITSQSIDNLKKESKEAKNLLKQEFGSKKDSTQQVIEHKEGDNPKVIIEWEDE